MSKNKTLVKELTSDTQKIFDRIKNKIDPRTKSAIISKLGITTHLASVKKLNSELEQLEQAVKTNKLTIFPPSIKSIKLKPKIIKVLAIPVLKNILFQVMWKYKLTTLMKLKKEDNKKQRLYR